MSYRPPHFDICRDFVDQANQFTTVPFTVLSILAIIAACVVLPLLVLLPLRRVPVVSKIQAVFVGIVRFFDIRLGIVNTGSASQGLSGGAAPQRGVYANLDSDGGADKGVNAADSYDGGFNEYGLGIESSRTVGGVLTLLFALFSLLFYIFLNAHYNSFINSRFIEQQRSVFIYPNTTKWQFDLYWHITPPVPVSPDCARGVDMEGMLLSHQRRPVDPAQPWDHKDVMFEKKVETTKYHDRDICHATWTTKEGVDKINNIDHNFHHLELAISGYHPLSPTSQDVVFFGVQDRTISFDQRYDPVIFSRSCRHWLMPAGTSQWVNMVAQVRSPCIGRGFGTMHYCFPDRRGYDFTERFEQSPGAPAKNEIRIFMDLKMDGIGTLISHKDQVSMGTYMAAFVTILIVLHPYIKRTICDIFAAVLKRWHHAQALSVRQAFSLIIMSTFYVAFFTYLAVHSLQELMQIEFDIPKYQVDDQNAWRGLYGGDIAVTVLAVLSTVAFAVVFGLFAFLFLARSPSGGYAMRNSDEIAASATAPSVDDAAGMDQ